MDPKMDPVRLIFRRPLVKKVKEGESVEIFNSPKTLLHSVKNHLHLLIFFDYLKKSQNISNPYLCVNDRNTKDIVRKYSMVKPSPEEHHMLQIGQSCYILELYTDSLKRCADKRYH